MTYALLLRVLVVFGGYTRAGTIAYRARARRLSVDAHGRIRRWGVSFDLNLNDNVQRTFYYTGWYERPFLEFLRRELRPDDTYVDVGAHIGIDAAFAARRVPHGKVVAFEAAPDTFAKLRASVGRLRNVRVVAAALGERTGRIALRANPKWHRDDASTRSRFGSGPIVCEAELVRFDDWAPSLERMDVVKLDVEGSELNVLVGMRESLERLRPRIVAVELYEPHLALAGATKDDVVNYLDALGYVRERDIGHNAVFRHRADQPAPADERRRRAGRPALGPAAITLVALTAWVAKAAFLRGYDPLRGPLSIGWALWGPLLLGVLVLAWVLTIALVGAGRREHARALVGFIPDCLVLFGRLVADPRIPRRKKLLVALLIGYIANPLDPIPDFLPIVGQLDDAVLTAFVLRRLLRAGGEPLVREHWPGPEMSLHVVLRLA